MSVVSLDSETFASLVGSEFGPGGTVLLFRVSEKFVKETLNDEWSDLVQFRFVGGEGRVVELEIRSVGEGRRFGEREEA